MKRFIDPVIENKLVHDARSNYLCILDKIKHSINIFHLQLKKKLLGQTFVIFIKYKILLIKPLVHHQLRRSLSTFYKRLQSAYTIMC